MGLSHTSLIGKVSVVTGAGRGIGKELARALAWLGAKVVIAEIADVGAEVEALIRSEGGTALFVKTNVADENSMNRLAKRTLKEFSKVDILVNNATIAKTGSILELPLEEWDRSWAVDVRAAVLGIKAFLPGMLERKDGTIVTITSGEGMPYLAPYSASKAALRSLGLSLAAELGGESGVSVFVFAPGMVDTPGIRDAAREMAPHYGMTYEAFISQRVNPGYDGLMPAEDCAAGFAYVIVHAKNYHGQIADAIQPLNKFGLLPTKPKIVPEPTRKTFIKKPETTEAPNEMATVYSQAVELAIELKETLDTVNKEFEEQSYFARMWAKRILQQRSGLSIKDWVQNGTDLVTQLQNLSRALEAGRKEEAKQIKAKLPFLIYSLEKLADYFQSTREDAKSFIKDPKVLSAAIEALTYREKTVRALISTLERIVE
jgi:NAD(P)-dependent dehydrogenase (short-subunit alcohol dehydrogenase family)